MWLIMENTTTHRRTARWTGTAGTWMALAVLVFGTHSLLAKPFYIPSESMMPTLRVGDRLVVSKYPYGWSYASASFHILPFMEGRIFGRPPARGDIVIVSRENAAGNREDLIKRVIGLPGDTVKMEDGRLWLNGKIVTRRLLGQRLLPVGGNSSCSSYASTKSRNGEALCRGSVFRETLPGGPSYEVLDLGPTYADDTAAYSIPAGHVFLMGDNRDNSADSRVPAELGGLGGAVPLESVSGRAEFLTFSLGENASWNPATWLGGFSTTRSGVTLRP
jgi:signal peptidase I